MVTLGELEMTRFSRRKFFRAAAVSPVAFQLAGANASRAVAVDRKRVRAKACIFLHITGGPAQQETFDMKPKATGHPRGEFDPIQSVVPGMDVCEFLPHTAKVTNHLAVIRSMHHDQTFHGAGTHLNLTGFPHQPRSPTPEFYLDRRDSPSIGAVLQHLHHEPGELPASVHLPFWIQQGNVGRFAGQDAGFLGRRDDPLRIFYETKEELPGELPSSFQLPPDLPTDRLNQRQNLLTELGHTCVDRGFPHWRRDRQRAL